MTHRIYLHRKEKQLERLSKLTTLDEGANSDYINIVQIDLI